MLIFKIILCIIVGGVGFFTFLETDSLRELRKKATKEEKKSLDRIETVALFSPLVIFAIILAL